MQIWPPVRMAPSGSFSTLPVTLPDYSGEDRVGMKEYFVPRQDGIQQNELDEEVCAWVDGSIADNKPTVGKGKDYAMFSIHDELIGPEGGIPQSGYLP